MKSTELRGRLVYNEEDLDREVAEQPELVEWAGRLAAAAAEKRDFLKDDIKTIEAQVASNLRTDGEKRTEARLKEEVLLDDQVRKVRREYVKACREADEADALKEAIRDRGFSLRKFVDLHVARTYTNTTFDSRAQDNLRREVAESRKRQETQEPKPQRRRRLRTK